MQNSIGLLITCLICFLSCKGQDKSLDQEHMTSPVSIKIKQIDTVSAEDAISSALLELELAYVEMLKPISSMKTEHPKIYWFIVSWLKTAYNTPDWNGYYSEEWKKATKENGIDCSGFSRVMQDQIFNRKIAGGSQHILDDYCRKISTSSLELGDLLFFRAPYASNDKIVHVGVYLMDSYFVHATSKKSAAMGRGLSVNSLDEVNWKNEFVSAGRIK